MSRKGGLWAQRQRLAKEAPIKVARSTPYAEQVAAKLRADHRERDARKREGLVNRRARLVKQVERGLRGILLIQLPAKAKRQVEPLTEAEVRSVCSDHHFIRRMFDAKCADIVCQTADGFQRKLIEFERVNQELGIQGE